MYTHARYYHTDTFKQQHLQVVVEIRRINYPRLHFNGCNHHDLGLRVGLQT